MLLNNLPFIARLYNVNANVLKLLSRNRPTFVYVIAMLTSRPIVRRPDRRLTGSIVCVITKIAILISAQFNISNRPVWRLVHRSQAKTGSLWARRQTSTRCTSKPGPTNLHQVEGWWAAFTVVLCDTWNRSDDNDTVSGIAVLDTTAIPEMRYAISIFFRNRQSYTLVITEMCVSSSISTVCRPTMTRLYIACCVYCMK